MTEKLELIARNIERLMREREFNPTSLAREAGLNQTAIRDIVSGRSRNPQLSTLEKIAAALCVKVGDLTGDKTDALIDQITSETRDATPEEKRAVLAYIRTLKATRSGES